MATNYNYGHVVKNPDTGSYYYFTSTISASVARADIFFFDPLPTSRWRIADWVKVETGGGGRDSQPTLAAAKRSKRVDSLVFTAVGSTTTQSVQQTLAATGFLVEDYESGGDSPVTAVASENDFHDEGGRLSH